MSQRGGQGGDALVGEVVVAQAEGAEGGQPGRATASEEGGVVPYVDTLSPRYTTRRICNTWRSLQGGEEG